MRYWTIFYKRAEAKRIELEMKSYEKQKLGTVEGILRYLDLSIKLEQISRTNAIILGLALIWLGSLGIILARYFS